MGPRRIASAHCCPAGPGAAPTRPAASAPAELPAPADRYCTRRARPPGAAAPRGSVQGEGPARPGGWGRGWVGGLDSRYKPGASGLLPHPCKRRAGASLGAPIPAHSGRGRSPGAAPLPRASARRGPFPGADPPEARELLAPPRKQGEPCSGARAAALPGAWLASPLQGRRSRGPRRH